MSEYGIKISKDGYDVMTTGDQNLVLSSNYDNLKVRATGTITISLPDEDIAFPDYETYSDSDAHGASYMPFYIPTFHSVGNDDYGTTNDFVVNDVVSNMPPAGTPNALINAEHATVYIDSTNIYLWIVRQCFDPGGPDPAEFGAHDAIFDYTVFYNEMDSEVDYT